MRTNHTNSLLPPTQDGLSRALRPIARHPLILRSAPCAFAPFIWATLSAAILAWTAATQPAHAEPSAWETEGWVRTDFSKHSVAWSEIISGGPGKDGIQPIDAPIFQAARDENRLADQEAVIGLEINGDARAYPIRLLMWHEIVNDTVGGVPVSVTYCPLCNAAIVFDRRTPAGILTFGTSG